MRVSRKKFKASYEKFDRHTTVWGLVCGLVIGAAAIVGLRLMFWSLDALHANSFPGTVIPIMLFFIPPMIATVPAKWFFIALARYCGLVCPACRRHFLGHERW